MTNDGNRPGLQVRIEFEAKGPIALRRFPVDREDGENEDATADGASKEYAAASVDRFPPAPKPPSFQKKITRIPPPAESNATHDLSILKGAALPGVNYGPLSQLSKQLGSFGAFAEAADMIRRQSGVFDALGANTLRQASLSTGSLLESRILKIPQPYIPKPRQPESFYYDWPAEKEVKKGALTCQFWRHQTGDEVFEFEVVFTKDGEARGAVECMVHAENLTTPEQAKVIVSRTVESLSIMSLANGMVETCE